MIINIKRNMILYFRKQKKIVYKRIAFKTFIIFLFIFSGCRWGRTHPKAHMWRSEDDVAELILEIDLMLSGVMWVPLPAKLLPQSRVILSKRGTSAGGCNFFGD